MVAAPILRVFVVIQTGISPDRQIYNAPCGLNSSLKVKTDVLDQTIGKGIYY